KGAQATAAAIFLCRFYAEGHAFDYSEPWSMDKLKTEITRLIEKNFDYDLSPTLDEIRPAYCFNESCRDTVPQAITAFLESTDFEDAIRNAISLGGDSDTLTAITGSIAEAAYGIPQWIEDKAWTYLDDPLRDVCRRWHEFAQKA
ncbi:MAG: ADP-ribosylglycohydrolase family protein, partial [Oscillospiraceae bacterium]